MLIEIINDARYKLSKLVLNKAKPANKTLENSFERPKDASFDFQMIEKYFKKKDNSQSFQTLSEKTCNDLDFDELFMYLDRTTSSIGQQFLYNRLRVIHQDESKTALNEKIIHELIANEPLRTSTQKKLEQLNKKESYYVSSLFQEEHPTPPKWFFILKLLSILSLSSLILSFVFSYFFGFLIFLFAINVVFHFWNKKNLVQYVGSIPQLLKLNSIATNLYQNALFKDINPKLLKSTTIINQVKRSMSFFQIESKLQGDTEIIAWTFFELFKTLFLLEPLLLFGVLNKLTKKRKEIEAVFEFIGQIDSLISIASIRSENTQYCIPKIQHLNSEITIKELKHPLIINCVKNNIRITNKSVLLTGSNMAGKTSFIRALGINVITGLTINTCFAQSMSFPLLRIHSAIRISDDLLNNKSYYFEEVLTIKNMLTQSKSNNNLFLLDELFKGTNTIERISSGKAILSALAKQNNKVLVSTHDIELADMLSKDYNLYHFSEILEAENVKFDYKLKEGKLKNRNAIRILEINNYPKEIIDEALSISKQLDNLNSSTSSHHINS